MATRMEYSPLTPSPASPNNKEPIHHVREHTMRDGEQGLGGRYGSIFLSLSIVTLPMLTFSAVLLGLVMKYRVQYTSGPYANLELQGFAYWSGSYYVDLSATFLIFVASWSSSVATIAAGFMTTLAAYPIAKKYGGLVEREQINKLFTPYQLALAVRLLDGGGIGALWEWLKYALKGKSRRQNQSPALKLTSSVAVLGTFLALLVVAADTWLHITTKATNLVQQTIASADFSMGLDLNCTTSNNSYTAQFSGGSYCSLNPAATATFLKDGPESLSVLSNVSSTSQVLVYKDNEDMSYAYLAVPSFPGVSNMDYTANTYGMKTRCVPLSDSCDLTAASGASTPFKCTNAFSGDVSDLAFDSVYFSDDTMQSNQTTTGITNPFYFGTATLVSESLSNLISDVPNIVTPVHGGVAYVLGCSSTLYDITYTLVNSSITDFSASKSNDSVANIWHGPMAFTLVSQINLQQAATVATLGSKSAQEIADKFAVSYSTIALATGAQVIRRRPALEAQSRTVQLVTQVPKVPLYALVAANMVFVVGGVVLAAVALGSCGTEAHEVQSRLSVVGLVADRFEQGRAKAELSSLTDAFEEADGNGSSRILIQRSALGGFEYRTLRP